MIYTCAGLFIPALRIKGDAGFERILLRELVLALGTAPGQLSWAPRNVTAAAGEITEQ